jgi:predicted enzyme related to lactoylglutathione lyase
MINGVHHVIYSTSPAKDRAFFRDVLKFSWVDAGDGWLIFATPPAELAVHPATNNDGQELFLMCDDLAETIEELRKAGTECTEVQHLSWGLLTHLTLPGGGVLGLYQPQHARPTSPK